MNVESFAQLELASGHPVTYNDGIWWNRIKPFYSWPLEITRSFSPGTARPPLSFRLIGYQHAVPAPEESNTYLNLMMIRDIKQYGLSCLSSKRRNQVRRALEQVVVRKIGNDELPAVLARGLEINRSALSRQGWAGNHSWYLNEKKWRHEIGSAQKLGSRELWGAFVENNLVAWLRAFELDKMVQITAAMSHSDFLRFGPNDALMHTFLTDCQGRPHVQSVIFGLECSKRSLNDFKMRFTFDIVPLPIYRWINPIAWSIARSTRFRHYLDEDQGREPLEHQGATSL